MKKNRQLQRHLLKIMRLSLQQILLAVLLAEMGFAGLVGAQTALDQKVTIHMERQHVKSVLNALKKKTALRFSYSSAIIPERQLVTIHASDLAISAVLDQIFEQTGIRYSLSGRQIILRKEEIINPIDRPGNIDLNTSPKADRKIWGSVKDNKGEGLPGVSIVVRGTQRGTLTDTDGNFQLSVPDDAGLLIFTFVGFEPKEVAISAEARIEVTLNPDVKALNEVVVTGYGTQKKANITGNAVYLVKIIHKSLNLSRSIRGQSNLH